MSERRIAVPQIEDTRGLEGVDCRLALGLHG